MKRLAISTVCKAFQKIGFVEGSRCMFLNQPNILARLTMQWEPQITISDGRWKEEGMQNVHIVSYWGWPQNTVPLNDIITQIVWVYSKHCNTNFNIDKMPI